MGAGVCPRCSTALAGEDAICPHCGADAAVGGTAPAAPLPARYEVKVELGTGGMGRVYLCRDRDLDVDVAVKVLPPEIARSPKHLARIESEAKVAARLRGLPGILALYGFERHGDACLLVMEYAAGGSVFDRVRDQGRVPESGCRRVGAEVADAIAQAHGHGVLHRDIKPGNILLDIHGRVKVADFGLGRVVEGAYAGPQDLPIEGTPVYMAPEVIRGRGADGRSDLYSLGATLYEMATGESPFRGSYRQIAAAKTAPGHRPPDPRALQPALSPEFAGIVTRLMEPDPAMRFPGAAACAEALRGGTGTAPAAAVPAAMAVPIVTPVATGPRAASGSRAAARRGGGVPVVALVAVVLVGGGIAAAFALRGGSGEPPPVGPERSPVAPPGGPLAAGDLVVVTKPPGATVWVDGRAVGATPSADGLRVPGLAAGTLHTVKATLDDHDPDEQAGVEWKKGQAPPTVVLRLVPRKGLLSIEGGPPGGRVALRRDGQVIRELALRDDGSLPAEMLDAGPLEVEVTARGFHPWRRTVRVTEARGPALRPEMRERDGSLTVATKPPGAEVVLGGRAGGGPLGKSPLAAVAVPPGKWTLTFEHPDCGLVLREIEVRGEEAIDLGVVELPAPAILDLSGLPAGVTAILAGESVAGIVRRAPGPVAITLQREGYQAQVAHVDLKSGPNPLPKPGPWKPLPGRLDLTGLGASVSTAVLGGHAYREPWTVVDAYPGVHPILLLRDGEPPVRLRLRVRSGESVAIPAPSFPERRRPRGGRDEDAWTAIGRGVEWLRRHQTPEGYWDSAGFEALCRKNKCGGPGYPFYRVGVTGLATLALLEARAVEALPTASDAAWRGLEWLTAIQEKDGGYGDLRGHGVYNHAIATLAVVEGYRATGDPWLRESAVKGVDAIVNAQNPFLAWRYGVRPKDNDTSVTAWMVRALAAAREAGIAVPESAFDGARNWLDKVTETEFGRAGYTARGNGPARPEEFMEKFPADRSESLAAAAVASRLLMGASRDHHLVGLGADLCIKLPPAWDEAAGCIDFYYWHYGTLALHQFGGGGWTRWDDALRKALLGSQRAAADDDRHGSWDPVDPWGKDGGRVYSTAINVLSLTLPFRRGDSFREPGESTALSLSSDPPGAWILADGAVLGVTPMRGAPVPAGRTALVLRHPEREDARLDVEVKPFTDNSLETVTLPAAAGRVDLSDAPRDASVFVDGRPAKGLASVRVGRRRVTVVRPGHFAQVLTVDVAAEAPAKPILGTWTAAPEWNRGPMRGLLGPPPEPVLSRVVLPADVVEQQRRLGSRADGVEMVLVAPDPAGGREFAPFLLDRHEVTVAQFQAFCKETNRKVPAQPRGSTGRHPVVSVTRWDAEAYAKWAGKRLPTREEWTRAAGGRGGPFGLPWGEFDATAARNLDGRDDGQAGLAPVGSYPGGMSPAGCLDLVGNAAEWIADGGAVGGSFASPPGEAREIFAVSSDEAIGFRCALTVAATK